jgi:hypothetical protein
LLCGRQTDKSLNHRRLHIEDALGLIEMKKTKRQIKAQNESALVEWFLTIDIDALGNTA